jgi:chromatin remodeling complex protein RSC6
MPKTKKTSKRKPNPAFMKPVQPDDKLAAIVGSQPLPRTELTKKLWNYIKRHGCQDKKKRTMINADDSLRPVFNGKPVVCRDDQACLEASAAECPDPIGKDCQSAEELIGIG